MEYLPTTKITKTIGLNLATIPYKSSMYLNLLEN